jgi:hypothetical protein
MEGDRRRSPEGDRRLRLFSCPLEAAVITSMIGKSILAEKKISNLFMMQGIFASAEATRGQ